MPQSIVIEILDQGCLEEGPSRIETLASPAGHWRFRIEEVFGLVEAFRYGDVIEVEALPDGAWRFQRVVEKGRYRQVSLLLSRSVQGSAQLQDILDQLVAHGGQWERMFAGWLTMAIPYGTSFNPLRRIRQLRRRGFRSYEQAEKTNEGV